MFSLTGTKEEYAPLTGTPTEGSNDDLNEQYARESSGSGHSWKIYASCFIVACLSFFNLSLLPFTLTTTHLTEAQLAKLPYPDQRLGIDVAAKAIPKTPTYLYEWPESIARLSQKLKNAVYGSGNIVFISAFQDSTIMRFRVPPTGGSTCAVNWSGPPAGGVRNVDLETKGDISEVEVWSVIAPNPVTGSPPGTPASSIDFDTLSWNTRPVQGELLGTLDLTKRPNSTTVEFACPSEDTLTVELRCLRTACHVRFQQVHFFPKMGFELVRRQIQ